MISPELDLLVACCRWPSGAARNEVVRARASAAIDWPLFARVVARHRVEGLVHPALRLSGVVVPSDIARALAEAASTIVRQNLVFAAAAGRVSSGLGSAGIAHLFVKGATLAMLAYGSLAYKSAWDIDLLVDPDAYDEACDLLASSGYVCVSPADPTPTERAAWVRRHKHTIWSSATATIELHASLVDGAALPGVDVHSPPTHVLIAPGLTLPTLGRDALFAYLTVHGAAHAWSRLKWIADVNALIRDDDDAEVERLYHASQELGAGRAPAQALMLCAVLFDRKLPPALGAAFASNRATAALVRIARGSMTRGGVATELDATLFGTVPIHLSQLLLTPGWRDKAAVLRRAADLSAVPAWILRRVRNRATMRAIGRAIGRANAP